jgi:hypothetical protein
MPLCASPLTASNTLAAAAVMLTVVSNTVATPGVVTCTPASGLPTVLPNTAVVAARPAASVSTDAGDTDAAPASGANVTVLPLTGLLNASRTSTMMLSGIAAPAATTLNAADGKEAMPSASVVALSV